MLIFFKNSDSTVSDDNDGSYIGHTNDMAGAFFGFSFFLKNANAFLI